jgi:hypothetical protein
MTITVQSFLSLAGEFAGAGSASTGGVTWLGAGVAGQTITVGALEFVAVAGARAAGSLTWSAAGSTSAQATSFAAMVADSEAADVITAAKVTPTSVTITTLATGPASELALETSTPATYQLTGPTLTGGSDLIAFALNVASSMVNITAWRSKATAATIYLAAHMLAVQTGKGGGETGVVVSRGLDRLSTSNASTSFEPTDAALASTRWGRMYLALRKTLLLVPAVTSARGWCSGR